MAITTGRRVAVTVASVSGRGFWLKFWCLACLVDPRSLHCSVIDTASFFAGQVSIPGPSWCAAPGTLLFARAGGLLCGGFATGAVSVAGWQRFTTRSEQTFVREEIPLRMNGNALRS